MTRQDGDSQRSAEVIHREEVLLQSGDHIYCNRKEGLFHHHGIVVRDGGRLLVYHVRKDRSCDDLCSGCKGLHQPESGPIISCLDCFRRQEPISIINYRKRVPRKCLKLKIADKSVISGKVIKGYCSDQLYLEYHDSLSGELYCHAKISPGNSSNYRLEDSYVLSEFSSCKSADEVVATARGGGGPGLRKYHLTLNNCEDFAVYCKTNNPRSIQVARRFQAFLPIPMAGRASYGALKLVHSITGWQICKGQGGGCFQTPPSCAKLLV